MILAALLGIATGALFAHNSAKSARRDSTGADPDGPSVFSELSGLAAVYTLGGCAFIMGYIGWWGGVDPPQGSMPGLFGALRNPGLIIVLGSWLIGFAVYRTLKR